MVKYLMAIIVGWVVLVTSVSAQFDFRDSVLDVDKQSRADTIFNALSSELLSLQNSYHTTKGRYWQGLPIFRSAPSSLESPDLRSFAYEDPDYVVFGLTLPVMTDVNLWIDTYESPKGFGFVYNTELQDSDGTLWHRAINYGPEEGKGFDWRISTKMYEI